MSEDFPTFGRPKQPREERAYFRGRLESCKRGLQHVPEVFPLIAQRYRVAAPSREFETIGDRTRPCWQPGPTAFALPTEDHYAGITRCNPAMRSNTTSQVRLVDGWRTLSLIPGPLEFAVVGSPQVSTAELTTVPPARAKWRSRVVPASSPRSRCFNDDAMKSADLPDVRRR